MFDYVSTYICIMAIQHYCSKMVTYLSTKPALLLKNHHDALFSLPKEDAFPHPTPKK